MSGLTEAVNLFFSVFALLGQIIFLVLLFGLFFLKNNNFFKNLFSLLGKNAILFGFIISLSATLGSLYYSEIAHFPPCDLCWVQRIFMYPQAIIFLIALIKKEKPFIYPLVLSIVGGLISIYNYYVQLGGPSFCGTTSGVSCAQRFVMEFGYITFPIMALTAFALIAITMVIGKRNI